MQTPCQSLRSVVHNHQRQKSRCLHTLPRHVLHIWILLTINKHSTSLLVTCSFIASDVIKDLMLEDKDLGLEDKDL